MAKSELHPSKLQQSPRTALTQGCLGGTLKMQSKAASLMQLQTISLPDPRKPANITVFAESKVSLSCVSLGMY